MDIAHMNTLFKCPLEREAIVYPGRELPGGDQEVE